MNKTKKHICIFFAYNNIEHIIQSFDSLYSDSVDYFVVENSSENSRLIECYFASQKLIGYIQFEKNIWDNAMKTFLQDYKDLISQYDYITITDGDLLIDDIDLTFTELKEIVDIDKVGVCCVDLKLDNFPSDIKGSGRWLPNHSGIYDKYIVCGTGIQLMTFKREFFDIILEPTKFLDGKLRKNINWHGLLWVKTKINQATHLTWDLYYEGSPYYEFKLQPKWGKQWESRYKKII